jgi:NitT/TauT family transport system substrate-binding protein
MAEAQTEQIDQSVLKASLYDSPMAGSTKLQLDFTISDDAKSLLEDATAFLYSLKKKPAAAAQIRPEGVWASSRSVFSRSVASRHQLGAL